MSTQLRFLDVLVDGELVREIGHKHAYVESRSHPGEKHCVSFEFNDANGLEEWVCTCEGFTFRHACRHVRAVDRWNAGLAVVEVSE